MRSCFIILKEIKVYIKNDSFDLLDKFRMLLSSRCMKKMTAYLFYLTFFVSVLSCKKQDFKVSQKKTYIQYFKANVAGQTLDIKNSIDENRHIFRGQYSEIGYGNGIFKEMYTINVAVPKTILNTSIDTKLQFQIFDSGIGKYEISSSDSYKGSFNTHVYIVTDLGMPSGKTYTTHETKAPFNILITRYEKAANSALPFVGGKLDGVLYNVKDLQDSIVIKDGSFDVRF